MEEYFIKFVATPITKHFVTCRLKPIFHCDAKPFALGPRFGLDPQRHNFALGIPTCWYLKMLKFALPPTPNLNLPYLQCEPQTPVIEIKVALGPQPQNSRIGHVHFVHFVCLFHSCWVPFFSGIWAFSKCHRESILGDI